MSDEMTPRRFPPPWDIEEHDQRCFIVRDNNGMALAKPQGALVTHRRGYAEAHIDAPFLTG